MNRPLLTRDDLRHSQVQIEKLVRSLPAVLIDSKMASGKTGATLAAIAEMLNRFDIQRVLVIAPLRVARDTWPEEVRTWEPSRFCSVAVAVGGEAERVAAIESDAEITVINFENLPWLVKRLGGAAGWKYDCVVVDESSQFKAGRKRTLPTTTKAPRKVWVVVRASDEQEIDDGPVFTGWREAVKWINTRNRKDEDGNKIDLKQVTRIISKVNKGGNLTRFGALASVRKKIRRIILLTGTPAPNGVRDLWGQIYLLDQGKRLGSTISDFEGRYLIKNNYTYEVRVRPGAEEEITSRIKDVMYSIPPPADLPKPTMIPVKVQLPSEVLKEYRRFKRQMVSELHDVEAVNNGVLTQKLLQFSNGSMYREDRSIAKIHDAKLDAFDDLVKQAAGDPMLALYGFRFDLQEMRRLYPKAVLLSEDKDAIKKWSDGSIKLLLAHPASCAHGLNLQYGGHLGIWFGLTWSLELYQQANARLARPGQKWPVAMYQIISEGTDDQRVLDALESRGSTQDDISKAVRRSIEMSQYED